MVKTIEETKIKYFMSNDVAFKTFFRKNPNTLKKVISMSLRIKESEIKNMTLLNTELVKDITDDKLGIVDLLIEINNKKKINIEMQNVDKHNFPERAEFYLSKIYVEDLEKGEDYSKVKEVYGIFFLNYDDENYPNFFSIIQNYDIMNQENTKTLKTMVVYNLSRIDEIDKYNFTDEEKDLLKFIKSKEESELKEMAEKSITLNEAMDQLRKINADKNLKELLFYAERQRLEENTQKNYQKKLEKNNKAQEKKIKKLGMQLQDKENTIVEQNEQLKNKENTIVEQNNTIQNLIKMLHQNNNIDEISKITNLEIDYIKNVLNKK